MSQDFGSQICEKGCILGDYYISVDLIPYFFKSIPDCEICDVKESSIGVGTRRRPNKSILESKDGLNLILNSGIELQDILFWRCRVTDIDMEFMCGIWRVISRLRGSNYRCYCCYTKEGKKLGYLLSTDDLFYDRLFHISMIEMCTKGEGSGTKVVKRLISLGKSLEGMSLVTAVEFWSKLGAIVDKSNYFVLEG